MYARITAVVLVSIGLAGLMGILSWTAGSSFYHLAVGLLFAYVGFVLQQEEVVRLAVGGLGMLLLLVKGATILAPLLWGEAPLRGPIEITCLVVGLLSILAAKYL